MLVWCWYSVVDGGPTSNQHWVNASSLLGKTTRPFRPETRNSVLPESLDSELGPP